MLNIRKNNRGVALVLVIMVISVLLFLSTYFLGMSLFDELIAKSQAGGVKAYYLAEAGVNNMIWLIINDPHYEVNFKYNDSWSTTTIRVDPFGTGSGSYQVTASNTSAAHCEVYAKGLYDIGGGNFAQRIVKTEIFRAIGTSTAEVRAGYADGNIIITNSYVNFLGGHVHSNNTFNVNNVNVQMYVDGDLQAVGNYLQHSMASTTIQGWIYSANWTSHAQGTGTVPEIIMPAVDFKSSHPMSYKNRAIVAGSYFTGSQFDDLICSKMGSTLTLTKEVTYVDGSVDLGGNIELKYPPTGGVLVVDGDFVVGSKAYKKCGGTNYYGNPDILFMHVVGKPSGILSSKKVQFLSETGNINIEGVVYANAEMDVNGLDPLKSFFYVRGGLIAQKLDIDSCYNWPTIEYDNSAVVDTIGTSTSSPTIIIEHWEEEY